MQAADANVHRIEVKIPAGINDGAKIRLRGQGAPGTGKGAAGDLLLTIHVAAHLWFTRRGERFDGARAGDAGRGGDGGEGGRADAERDDFATGFRRGPVAGRSCEFGGHGVKPKTGTPGDLFAEIQIVLPAGD